MKTKDYENYLDNSLKGLKSKSAARKKVEEEQVKLNKEHSNRMKKKAIAFVGTYASMPIAAVAGGTIGMLVTGGNPLGAVAGNALVGLAEGGALIGQGASIGKAAYRKHKKNQYIQKKRAKYA